MAQELDATPTPVRGEVEEKKAAAAKAPSAQTPPTALAVLLQNGDGEVSAEVILDAMLNGSGLVISTSEVRRYVQHSGKKVRKVADGILSIGVNVGFIRTLHNAIKDAGPTIGIGDALTIVREEFGVEIPPKVIKLLELASGGA